VVLKSVPAGGQVAMCDGVPQSGSRDGDARRGRADIVVSTLDDVDIAALAAGWLAMRKT
jgi:hypothetical protein